MRALIPVGLEMQLSQVNAPQSTAAKSPYNKKLLPTFVLRRKGDAWANPFAIVYESHTQQADESPAVQSVERIMQDGVFKGLKVTVNQPITKISTTISTTLALQNQPLKYLS